MASMSGAAMCALVLLAAACVADAQGPGPTPGPGAGCSMATDKKACGKEKGCLWCEGSFGPASCYDESQAKFLPKQFFKCKKPKHGSSSTKAAVAAAAEPNPGPGPGPTPGPTPGPGAGCSMATDKKACGKEKGCLWCEGSFGPGSCYDEAQAKFLPKQFYKCKKPKHGSNDAAAAAEPNPGPGPGPGPTPGPGAGCSMATDKKACGKEKGCLWCEGSFGPGSCYDETQAKFLPKQFYKCKKPKHGSNDAAAAAEPNPGPGPGPGPGPTPGAGCSMATDKKACGKEKGCLWCEGSFGPASCYSKDQAKLLPAQMYKCKKAKKEEEVAAGAGGGVASS